MKRSSWMSFAFSRMPSLDRAMCSVSRRLNSSSVKWKPLGAVGAFFGAGVEAFELFAQVADECGFVGEARQVVVALGFEGFDEFGFELCFALVLTLLLVLGLPFLVVLCFGKLGDDGEVLRAEDAFGASFGGAGVVGYGFHGVLLCVGVECVAGWAKGW